MPSVYDYNAQTAEISLKLLQFIFCYDTITLIYRNRKAMNKLVKKTALITLAAIVAAAAVVFSLWLLISPQTMAGVCEKTGNFSFAVTCANMRYDRTKDAYDLARCAEDSILSGNDNLIINYCDLLIKDEKYSEVCKAKNEEISNGKGGEYIELTGPVNYDGYIKSHLCAAEYRSGNFQNALYVLGTDSSLSAAVKLVLEISERSDKQAASSLLELFGQMEQTDLVKQLTEILENITQR